jgi:hypothetical protein
MYWSGVSTSRVEQQGSLPVVDETLVLDVDVTGV